VYDTLRIGDDAPLGLPAGKQQFIDAIVQLFPNERDVIEMWAELCTKMNQKVGPRVGYHISNV
jgi:hypothetical protein